MDGNPIGSSLDTFFAKLVFRYLTRPTHAVRAEIGWRTSSVRVSFVHEIGNGTDRRRPCVKNKKKHFVSRYGIRLCIPITAQLYRISVAAWTTGGRTYELGAIGFPVKIVPRQCFRTAHAEHAFCPPGRRRVNNFAANLFATTRDRLKTDRVRFVM